MHGDCLTKLDMTIEGTRNRCSDHHEVPPSGLRSRWSVTREIRVGRVKLELGETEPCGPTREPDPSEADGLCYLLMIPLSGRLWFVQNGRKGVVDPDGYVLFNRQVFHEVWSEPGQRVLTLHVPLSDLRGRLASVEDHISQRFAPNETMTRLLVCLLRGITDVFGDRDPPNPEALATEIISFVALTLGAEDCGPAIDVRNARYHLRRRIFDFIERNLGDQDLSPKKIAASSRISLSYLYSLFNDDDTTVGQFVQNKRLQRAYEILVADARGHRTIAEIAYQVGFKNVSHFSRSFSRHFRVAPRDVRHVALPPVRPAPVSRSGALLSDGLLAGGFYGPSWTSGEATGALGTV